MVLGTSGTAVGRQPKEGELWVPRASNHSMKYLMLFSLTHQILCAACWLLYGRRAWEGSTPPRASCPILSKVPALHDLSRGIHALLPRNSRNCTFAHSDRSIDVDLPSAWVLDSPSGATLAFCGSGTTNPPSSSLVCMMIIELLHTNSLFLGEDLSLQIVILELPKQFQRLIIKSDTSNMA